MVVPHFIFLVGLWLTKWRRASWRSDGSSITVAGLLIGVLFLPAIGALWPVWQQRQLWAAFAARHDWIAIRALLPWEALCLPVMAAGCLWRFTGRRSSPLEREVTEPSASVNQALGRSWWMWLCAWCLPCLCVYLLSVSGWAALMHRRYVFAASLPLAMWLAIHLCRLPTTGRRLLVLAFSLVALWYQQGSLAILASGRWPTAERGEDWREAVAWINDQATAGEPAWIFCASSLIEAAEPQAVLQAVSNSPEEQWTSDSSASDRSSYLTFPLRTIYRLRPAVHLVPLANDPKSWPASWRQVGRPRASPIWLVVRCHARALPARLAAAGMVGGEHRDFGGVQVIRNVGFKD